ncbi:hypothetical protein A8708_26815 [Paenibacillus oryzisoli]|uniref:Uncharacterized protein n=1 Tax=Paenibacillus oryzisoli TaxID=1850517 RepID=A0A198AEH7_9BACL|nr:hypothetical protein A8708_26815 [Paenibacillus oryzisoli]
MKIKDKQIIFFYTVKGSTIKRVILLDILLGTVMYYVVDMVASSTIIAMIGSFIGTEGVKRLPRPINRRIITVT